MTGKTITIDFGHVFTTDGDDTDKVARRIEKSVQLNVNEIIDRDLLRHRHEPVAKARRVIVTDSIEEN